MSTERDEAEGSQPLGIPRVAIVGGGLAGLCAALRLTDLARESNRSLDITVFEASDRLGGAIETLHERDYLIERGADSFLTKRPIVRLCERLNLAESLIPTDVRYRGALVLRNGKPYPVPEGFGLMVPAKLLPILTSPILSPKGKLRLLAESLIPAKRDDRDESLSSFVRRRLGDEAFERLVQPLISGIYTADPEKLSLAATLPRFLEMERRYGGLIRATLRRRGAVAENDGSASGARYGLFAGLKGGMEELFTALAKQVEISATVVTGARIDRVTREGEKWCVETRSA
nr:protoporphyrinogen oxidase [Planctomycetaceae bacterium]